MPVNLPPLDPAQLQPIAGVRIGIAEAGVRKANRKDLTVFLLDEGASVAGVFTRNRFCAAPVQVCREHLSAGSAVRALVINTGNANAGTGAPGLAHARQTCEALAGLLRHAARHPQGSQFVQSLSIAGVNGTAARLARGSQSAARGNAWVTTGTLRVVGIAPAPNYTYDPDRVSYDRGDKTVVVPAGPNNPVGSVWIDLSRDTYGIHGTPDPSKVGKTFSNGCVRLTNWDAWQLAAAVKPGVEVRFV